MNPIEIITGLPNWQWKPHSQNEIDITGEELLEMSDFAWRVGNVAMAGFVYSSYTSPPWMWFVLAEGVKFSDLLDFRRLSTLIPHGTLAAVASDFAVGLKFAKFYGFEEMNSEIYHLDRAYKVMRKA